MCSKVLNGHIILTDTSITTILAPEMTYTPKNIRTTQIYATITHSKLDGDMERLSKRLDTLYRDTDLEKVRERL